jgi:hypothetical protein
MTTQHDRLFVLLKQHLEDHHQFHNHEEVEIAVREHSNATA